MKKRKSGRYIALLLSLMFCFAFLPMKAFAEETHTVTFDTRGGTEIPSVTVNHGEKVSRPPDPERPGYTFLNWYWYPDGDTSIPTPFRFDLVRIEKDITIYADYNIDHNYPRTPIESLEAEVALPAAGDSPDMNPTTDGEGYRITGVKWHKGTWLTAPEMGAGEKFAKGQEYSVFITFKKEDLYTFSQGITATINGLPADFSGFSDVLRIAYYGFRISEDGEAVHTITFDSDGGTAVRSLDVRLGEKAIKPEEPTKEGYIFGGWYTDRSFSDLYDFENTIIHSNITLYAKWLTPVTSAMFYLKNYASSKPISDILVTESGSNTGIKHYENDWRVVSENGTVYPSSSTEMTAAGKQYDIHIIFFAQKSYGFLAESLRVTLNGNEADHIEIDSTYPLEMKVTAKFKLPMYYTVSFDANGGSGTMIPEFVEVQEGDMLRLPECSFTPPPGKSFKAWEFDGTELKPGAGPFITANKTVKAIWKYNSGKEDSGGSSSGGGSSLGGGGSSGGGSSKSGLNTARYGSWKQDATGWWYQYADGSYPKNEWKLFPFSGGNAWYAFSESGYMRTGWFLSGEHWYYLSTANDATLGKLMTGWIEVGGKWYYLETVGNAAHPQGAMYSDEKTPDGYTVDVSGAWVK